MLVSFALFFATIVNAQVSFGLRGGYVNALLDAKPAGSGYQRSHTSHLNSWQAGFYLDIPVFPQGYIQPGVSYIVKGANIKYDKEQTGSAIYSGVSQIKLQYIELPVNFIYKIPVGFGRVALGAGPYAAYSIRGDYELSVYNGDKTLQSNTQQLDFRRSPNIFSTNMELRRWDAGFNFTAGLELNSYLTFGVNYSLGLMDIDKGTDNVKNRYLGVNLGILFNREDW